MTKLPKATDRSPNSGLRPAASGTKSDPPAHSWEEPPAFREIFLILLPPLAAESFREAGRHLYAAAVEHPMDEPTEPWLRTRLRALAEDLRFGARVLATLADARVEASLNVEELALAMKAEAWAGEVAAVVLGIEGALEGRS